MYEHNKKSGEVERKGDGSPKAKTSHSLNPVPCVIFDPAYKGEYEATLKTGLGISSIAATCIELLGFQPPADYTPSIISLKH
jgi:2,3-bisphosphoglycerate-independent phosphoglycerate mutase